MEFRLDIETKLIELLKLPIKSPLDSKNAPNRPILFYIFCTSAEILNSTVEDEKIALHQTVFKDQYINRLNRTDNLLLQKKYVEFFIEPYRNYTDIDSTAKKNISEFVKGRKIHEELLEVLRNIDIEKLFRNMEQRIQNAKKKDKDIEKKINDWLNQLIEKEKSTPDICFHAKKTSERLSWMILYFLLKDEIFCKLVRNNNINYLRKKAHRKKNAARFIMYTLVKTRIPRS